LQPRLKKGPQQSREVRTAISVETSPQQLLVVATVHREIAAWRITYGALLDERSEGFGSNKIGRIGEFHFTAAGVTMQTLQTLPWVTLTSLTPTARHHPRTHAPG
jgi:hypothetical protein